MPVNTLAVLALYFMYIESAGVGVYQLQFNQE